MRSICLYFALFLVAMVTGSSLALEEEAESRSDTKSVYGRFPVNDYEYSLLRDRLLEEEDAFEGHNLSSLSPDELIVNNYLDYLKRREFNATRATGFPPSRPIEEMLGYIRGTEVFKALRKLPKGGNMHSHENHELSKRTLYEIVWNSTDYRYLYMLPPDHPKHPWKLDFFVNPPDDSPAWIKVKGSAYGFEEILQHQTLMGILTDKAKRYPSDSRQRWKEIDVLWGRGSSQIVANINIKLKYLEALYLHGLNEGVTYYESRDSFGHIYELDPSGANNATNGKKHLDEHGDLDVQLTLQLVEEFTATHPEFIGHRRISHSHRMDSLDERFKAAVDGVARLNAKYPDHVMGFDTVGQEDAGNSLLYYRQRFIEAGSNLPLYLHTAETSWPDDLMTTGQNFDPVSTLQNSVDALLLMSRRLGHADGLFKHPYRMDVARREGIAIECCPVSNQMLGYVPDLRQHPAQMYFRSGIPVVLGADDPGTMGYDDFTVDWYEVYMAWGLDLSDLKKLALNSLQYSTMTDSETTDAIERKWKPMWNRYIDAMKTEACRRNFSTDAGPLSFAGILPREGANSGTTRVHIYGRNFEPAICKPAKCRFGTSVTPARYIDSTHLICDAPAPVDSLERTVSVYVALDGNVFVSTAETFTYKYAPLNRTFM